MDDWVPVNGIVALCGAKNVVPLLNRGLRALASRAPMGFVASTTTRAVVKATPSFALAATSVVGGCLTREVRPQAGVGLVHGWLSPAESYLSRLVPAGPFAQRDSVRVPAEFDGEFSATRAYTDGLGIVREPVGTRPLFTARTADLVAVASEPAALLAMGLAAHAPVPPGCRIYASRTLVSTSKFHHFPGVDTPISARTAARQLISLLRRAVRRRMRRHGHIALAFSGGLDSSILARLVGEESDVVALSVSTAGAHDAAVAPRAAAALDLPLSQLTLRPAAIARRVRELGPRLPRTSSMDLSIAVAIRTLAQGAHQRGCSALMVGQLADELFGGYHKYLQVGRMQGPEAAEELMRAEVLNAHEVGLPRDEIAAAPYAQLVFPYAAVPVVDFGLGLPFDAKLALRTRTRKVVLRHAAELLEIPGEVAQQAKKALQYSTGLQRLVERLLS
jgi:asparagine synthase (glutamine-hydrolysing)